MFRHISNKTSLEYKKQQQQQQQPEKYTIKIR